MSEILPKYIQRRGLSHFILTFFQAAITETKLHKKWLNAVVLHEYIHQQYCSDGLQFTLVAMMRCINNAYQNSSYNAANYVEASEGTKLDMQIQHQRQQGKTKKSSFFYITKTGAAAPALPTAGNTSAWEAAIAVNQMFPPARTRQRPELVDVELVSNLHQRDSRKRQLVSPSSPCRA
jgi:hypothetical protein